MGPGPVIPPGVSISWPGPSNLRHGGWKGKPTVGPAPATPGKRPFPAPATGVWRPVAKPTAPVLAERPVKKVMKLNGRKASKARRREKGRKRKQKRFKRAVCPAVPKGYYRNDGYGHA